MSDWKNVQYKDGKYRTSEGGGGGSSTFAGLEDVSFSDLQNGQVPKYNSTTQKWENADESGGGGTVTDVEVDGVSVVNQQGVAEIEMPNIPVQDVQVDGTSVVNAQGVAEITMPTPPTPDYPVTDVKVNGTSVVSNKQALITSYKEVTQAQYEALPDTKLSDNILYAIKDGGQAVDGFPPLIYSDEEREIGVWRDGKPLYQKTVNFTTTSGNAEVLDLTALDIDNLVYGNGYAYESNGNTVPVPYCTSNSDYTGIYYIRSTKKLMAYLAGSYNLCPWVITLRYTKTADTPGSGTWNQQGALAHHYSTDEKVIGTWTDGKPIYEKVISPLTTTSGNYVLDVSSLHINDIIDFRIFVHNSTGGDYAFDSYWQDSNDKLGWYLQSNKNNLIIRSGNGYAYGTGWCVIQYTKTTD